MQPVKFILKTKFLVLRKQDRVELEKSELYIYSTLKVSPALSSNLLISFFPNEEAGV